MNMTRIAQYPAIEELNQTAQVDARTVDMETLVDISDVTTYSNLSPRACIMGFVCQIWNPYCYKLSRSCCQDLLCRRQ